MGKRLGVFTGLLTICALIANYIHAGLGQLEGVDKQTASSSVSNEFSFELFFNRLQEIEVGDFGVSMNDLDHLLGGNGAEWKNVSGASHLPPRCRLDNVIPYSTDLGSGEDATIVLISRLKDRGTVPYIWLHNRRQKNVRVEVSLERFF